MYVYLYAHAWVCVCVYTHVCMYMCMYVRGYVYVCVHIYKYVYLGNREYSEEFGELWVNILRGPYHVLSCLMPFYGIYRHINNQQTMENGHKTVINCL